MMKLKFDFSISDILFLLQGITLCEDYFENELDLKALSRLRCYITNIVHEQLEKGDFKNET